MNGQNQESALRQNFQTRLVEARARTDELLSYLHADGLYDRPIPERHRNIFYLGHFEAFDCNLVYRGACEGEPFHESFDRLFAFGIDPVDGKLPTDQPDDWPAVEEVREYNRKARRSVDDCLKESPLLDTDRPALRNGYIFNIAIEHRLMHAETFAYLLHQMPLEKKDRVKTCPVLEGPSVERKMVEIPAGSVALGLESPPDEAFGWDNEKNPRRVEVPRFALSAHNVTNGEFLEFVRSGAYGDKQYWNEEGWKWKTSSGMSHPGFWAQKGEEWYCRLLFDEIPLPRNWPVYGTYAEADAYARWAGKELPTEEQLHYAAYGAPGGVSGGEERDYPWGDETPEVTRGNFDFGRWDPTPVGYYPSGQSDFGIHDLLGNGWEWTRTVFEPFEGFDPFPLYPGYSANFFDGKHYVIKGGSARTAACMLRRTFRNWFQPHYPYLYAAFRLVEN